MGRNIDGRRPINDTQAVEVGGIKTRIRSPWWRPGDRCRIDHKSSPADGAEVIVRAISGPYTCRGSGLTDPWLYYVDEPARGEHYPVDGRMLRLIEAATEANP